MKTFILSIALLSTVACGKDNSIQTGSSNLGSAPNIAPAPVFTPTTSDEIITVCGDMRLAALDVVYKSVTGQSMPCGTYDIMTTDRIQCPGVGDCLSYVDGTAATFTIYVAHAAYSDGGAWNGYACSALPEAAILAQFGQTVDVTTRAEWVNKIYQANNCSQN